MPQPYKGNWGIMVDALKKRPKLAEHVGIIASKWSNAESKLGWLFSVILGTDAELGTAMYMAIISPAAQKAAMLAAAEHKLDSAQLEKLKTLYKNIEAPRVMRNTVVHGLWALPQTPHENPESIVLIDTAKFVKMTAAMSAPLTSIPDGERDRIKWLARHSKATSAPRESALEYKEADFIEIEDKIDAAIQEIRILLYELSPKPQMPSFGTEFPKA